MFDYIHQVGERARQESQQETIQLTLQILERPRQGEIPEMISKDSGLSLDIIQQYARMIDSDHQKVH